MAGRGRGMTTPAWMTQGVRPPEQAPGGLQPPYMPQPPSAFPPMYGGPPPPYGAQPPQGPSFHPMPPFPPPGVAAPPFPYPPGSETGYGMPPQRQFEGETDRKRRRGRSADGEDSKKKPYASSRVGGSDRTTLRARRIYVKGTENLTERDLKDFFNSILHESAGIENGALAVTVNEKNFSFVEFSEVEIMHAFLEMGSIPFRGRMLLLQKPRDYELLRPLGQIPYLDLAKVTNPDLTTSMLSKTTKVKLQGLSPSMSEVTVAELLAPFGELKTSPTVVRDARTGKSECVALAEFADTNAAEAAIKKHSVTASTGEVITIFRVAAEERSGSASRPYDSRPPRRNSPGGVPSRGGGGRGNAFPPQGQGGGAPYFPPSSNSGNPGAYYSGGMPPPFTSQSTAYPPPSTSFPPPHTQAPMPFPYAPPPGNQPPQGDPRQIPQQPPPLSSLPLPYAQQGGGGGLPPMYTNNSHQPPPPFPPGGGSSGLPPPYVPGTAGGLPPPYGGPPPPSGPPQQPQPPYGGYGQPPQASSHQPQGSQPYYPSQGSQQYGMPPSSTNNGPPSYMPPPTSTSAPPSNSSSNNNGMYASMPPASASSSSSSSQPTSVLLLLNMVTREELSNPEEYQEIFEDTEGEARKFGAVERVVIPRTGPGAERVFIQYKMPSEAKAAFQALNGRKFSHRTVEARYYNEDTFAVGNLGM